MTITDTEYQAIMATPPVGWRELAVMSGDELDELLLGERRKRELKMRLSQYGACWCCKGELPCTSWSDDGVRHRTKCEACGAWSNWSGDRTSLPPFYAKAVLA